jgi:hypothetical protein
MPISQCVKEAWHINKGMNKYCSSTSHSKCLHFKHRAKVTPLHGKGKTDSVCFRLHDFSLYQAMEE